MFEIYRNLSKLTKYYAKCGKKIIQKCLKAFIRYDRRYNVVLRAVPFGWT